MQKDHTIIYIVIVVIIAIIIGLFILNRYLNLSIKTISFILIIPSVTSYIVYRMIKDRTDKHIVDSIKKYKIYYIVLAIITGLSIIAPIIYFKIKSRRNNYIYIN